MQITKKRHFTVDKQLKKPVEMKWLNRLGSWDAMHFTRYKLSELKATPTSFTSKAGTLVSTVKGDMNITYYSPLLTEAHFYWLIDLKLSPRILVDGRLMNIVAGSFKYDNYGDNFYELEITLTPANDEKSIKI